MLSQFCKVFCFATLLLGQVLVAKVIYVDDNASAGGDGTSWASAHKYLQDALASAEYGDEIWVAEGTYKPDQGEGKTAGDRASPFVLVNGVGMYGGFLGTENSRDPQGDNNQTILSGEIDEDSELWSLNVVSGANLDANTTLDGFRITKGNANSAFVFVYGNGGGMHLKDSNLTCSNLVITNNSADYYGGGIYSSAVRESDRPYSFALSYYSNLTLTNCVFKNNSAGYGGGISGSHLTIANCVFKNNSAGYGGGIEGSHLTITNCEFTNNSAGQSGGGISTLTLTLTNCVFTNNSADSNGGGISLTGGGTTSNCVFTNNSAARGGGIGYTSNIPPLTLINCVLTNNSASDKGGGINDSYIRPNEKTLTLTNCILWKNISGRVEGHGLESPLFKSVLLQEGVKSEYPGDPKGKDAVYEPNLNILQGWDGDARAFDADPLFVNIDNPIGPDGVWFTDDDGLRPVEGSPAIDSGHNDSLPADTGDLDNDRNTTEPLLYDAIGQTRRIGTKVDLGPYEFDPANPPPVVKLEVSLIAGSGGTVSGAGYFEEGFDTNISATASAGYVFSNWGGDANGSSNPLTITVDSAKNITANFAQDLNDTDSDGLSNYAEMVTHGTKVDDNDTDDDGLFDNEEIQIGTDPKVSNASIFNFFNSKSTVDKDNARSAGQTAGIVMVTSNPSAYNLVTQDAYDQMMNDLMFASDTNATHYTEGWFYHPSRGWMWTDRSAYPYFYDATDKDWMYFQSGNDKPKFYRYKTKTWLTVE